MTPSQARNAIRRSLKTLVDPSPAKQEKDAIWHYFDNACAYCGYTMTRHGRQAHLDHLVAEMAGGSNRMCNLVLTCARCNGDQKRELDWQEYLATCCGEDKALYNLRLQKIYHWVEQNEGAPLLAPELAALCEQEFDLINQQFSEAVARLREIARQAKADSPGHTEE
uniref:HNH endonuclease n=1 Tax=Marinobacterium profundum TaxID=1714300 RepID=UPI00083245FC|nr:HNH endonuclease [Marinobacterium profundum]